jgi:hypothetical protein
VDDQLFAVGAGGFMSGITGDQHQRCVVYIRQMTPNARREKTGVPGFPGLFPVFWENLGGARPQRLFRC